jgi:ankyrin repeat protein
MLLERGAEVNSRNKNGWTPLLEQQEPWEGKSTFIVQLLLDHGADVQVRNQ